MRSLVKLTIIQTRLFLREPTALFFTLLFPALLLVLFGAVWGNEPTFGTPYGYIDFQVPALSGIVIGTVALMSIPVTTANNREKQILRRYKVSPLPAWHYIASDIVVNFTVALASMGLLVLIGRQLFDLRFSGHWGSVVAGFTLSALAFMAFGYLVAGVAPSPRVAQVTGNLLYFPMMFLSGAALPLQILPEGVRAVSDWLPMTHMVTLLQDLWFGAGWTMTPVWVLVGLLVVGGVLSSRFFRWEA